jgi:hypothetical protein
MSKIINIADLRSNDPHGRSYREMNAAKVHRYSIGALVEFLNGPRLWVVHHARDCDGTPLYCLAFNPHDTKIERDGFYNNSWTTGIPEGMLTFIRMLNGQ